jgi:hypothetical protein
VGIEGAHCGLVGGGNELIEWARILAYITGTVDQELLLRNEYPAAENRILKAQLHGRLRLSDAERRTLGEIGHRPSRKALGEVATAALPDSTRHHLGVVPKARRPQIRWVACTSSPGQAANRRRNRRPDRSYGQGKSVLGLLTGLFGR